MALFNECTQLCAHILLDMADIVRDGDLSPITVSTNMQQYFVSLVSPRLRTSYALLGAAA